jgi:LysR family hydrogen peroxide-inducible transcriptional activator
MDISWLTLRDLQYLVAVSQYLHFGKAAQSCRVSQPALSVQIKKMEDLLGVSLFERSNRSVVLTEVGHRIVAQAKVVLDEAAKLGTLSQGAHGPLSRTLKLGAIATLGPYFIPFLLGPLKKAYPEAKLLIREGLTEDLLHQLRAGTLDAVLASPPFEQDGLQVIPLFVEPFVLAAPKGHHLSRKDSVRTADLKASEMVLLEDGHCLKDQTLSLCTLGRRGNVQEFQATSLETLKHLVAEGLGYTLVPLLAAKADPKLDQLIEYRAFSGKGIGRTISLVCRARYSGMGDIDALAQFIRNRVPDRCELSGK